MSQTFMREDLRFVSGHYAQGTGHHRIVLRVGANGRVVITDPDRAKLSEFLLELAAIVDAADEENGARPYADEPLEIIDAYPHAERIVVPIKPGIDGVTTLPNVTVAYDSDGVGSMTIDAEPEKPVVVSGYLRSKPTPKPGEWACRECGGKFWPPTPTSRATLCAKCRSDAFSKSGKAMWARLKGGADAD